MKKIKVFRVMETSYENGSYWIEYNVNGAWGYEIVYNIEKLPKVVSDDEVIKKLMDDNLSHNSDIIEHLISSELATGEETKLENARIYYQELFNTDIELNKKLTSKPYLSVCDDNLKDYIEECRQSENEMWYITEEDLEEEFGNNQEAINNYIEKLQEEAKKLGVNEYIEFYQDDYDVVVFYGGIITQFLFGEENVDSDIEFNKVYTVSELYRFIHNTCEIESNILLVTKDYEMAKAEFNKAKKSWEEYEFEEHYKDGNIFANSYDDEGDGITISLEAWNI